MSVRVPELREGHVRVRVPGMTATMPIVRAFDFGLWSAVAAVAFFLRRNGPGDYTVEGK